MPIWDRTQAVQRTVDDAIRAADGLYDRCAIPIDFGPEVFTITDTIRVVRSAGVLFRGSGRGTRFVWAGPLDKPMFLVGRLTGAVFTNITCQASTPCDAAFWVTNLTPGTDPWTSTGCEWRHVLVDGFGFIKYGWRCDPTLGGGADGNNDLHKWYKCRVQGYTDYGWLITGSQAHRYRFDFCENHGLGVAKGVLRTEDIVSFVWNGGSGGVNAGYDFDLGSYGVGYTEIVGWNSESTIGGLVRVRGGADAIVPLSIRGCRWDGHPTADPTIDFNGARGPLRIDENFLTALDPPEGVEWNPVTIAVRGWQGPNTTARLVVADNSFRHYRPDRPPVITVPANWTREVVGNQYQYIGTPEPWPDVVVLT